MADVALDSNIIAALGIQALPEAQRIVIVNQAADLVQKRVLIRLLEMMSEQDAAEAEKYLDDPDRLLAFMGSKIADLGSVVNEEVGRLRAELVSGAEEGSAEGV